MSKEVELIEKIIGNMEKVIIGKNWEIRNILKGIISNGHILIEDIPGVGKTMLVKALAKSFNLSYSRIQFTPDLLPSDITGVSIYNQKTMEFQFIKGPIFANIVLGDEINRTSPKTQAALLEVMEERQVSEGNNVYKLQRPFFVLATQNPIEYEGTYPLPEAQLDRFMMKVSIGYPSEEAELSILNVYRRNEPIETIGAVAEAEDILSLQAKVREVYVNDDINKYIINIINATRNNKFLVLGASTRATLALLRVSQANALMNGRNYVVPEDVKENALSVLSHRIILTPSARVSNYTSDDVVRDILNIVPVPKVNENDKDK
ncbi:AAA family ATPase [Haloimpatiens lingqiaonensis]|uniref:AAA family ATPase n=1 Tax=Haloimpatiens lingqiaonensis TaxID=1380675 RepID=UPI0010FD647C|nr:MoxR family ATPase [Haloimpatiens lingqiaonensis]